MRASGEPDLTALRVLACAVGVGALLLLVAYLYQDRLIYLPSGEAASPGDAGLSAAQVVDLRTDDGLALTAWYVPPEGETVARVLVLPGNAGNRSLRAPLALELSRHGIAVLLLDYRGYGGNPGRPSFEGVLADGRAAVRHLASREDTTPLVYFGESLGAGVATALAGERPPDGLILRSPFTSLADVGALHYPFLPVRRLLRDEVDVEAGVARYDGPVLVVAGERDTIVPVEQSRAVAEAAGGELVVVPRADHNDRALLDGRRLIDAVVAFVRRLA